MAHENPKDQGHDQSDGSGDFKRDITQHAAQIQVGNEKGDTHKRNQVNAGVTSELNMPSSAVSAKVWRPTSLRAHSRASPTRSPNAESNGDLGCGFSRGGHGNARGGL